MPCCRLLLALHGAIFIALVVCMLCSCMLCSSRAWRPHVYACARASQYVQEPALGALVLLSSMAMTGLSRHDALWSATAERIARWLQDGPKMAPDGPRWFQDGPRWPQDGPRTALRWPQDGPKMAQEGPRWIMMAEVGPRWPQDGPRCPQDTLR